MSALRKFASLMTIRSDFALAFIMVLILIMMILPIPTLMVDIMIALNMGMAMVLLMIAIHIPTPLAFSSFPAVLLITTLFRLSLSVTTTRLILLDADAGEIVYAFGNFTVSGSIIVGVVVFLIITIVSFIVVTKGAERVAEVSARFVLDGMPGKQMSIDSDMRSGVISMEEARDRRHEVELESRLYGAMDGAMKFVKGDAIAGLIITFVNILGGISIGIVEQGMSASEALELYAILTIGDGLVAQIPALFIAVTAGLIVTRISTAESENLGSDIGKQVLAQPNALFSGAALLFCFAWMPGFPAIVFLSLSIMTGSVGYFVKKGQKSSHELLVGDEEEADVDQNVVSSSFAPHAPVIIEVSSVMKERLDPTLLNSELAKVRRALYQSLGVPFPGVHLRFNNESEAGQYTILIYDIPVAQGVINYDAVLPLADDQLLELSNIPFEAGNDFLPDIKTRWVEAAYFQQLLDSQIDVMSAPQILSHHLAHALRRHASKFVGIQETHMLLSQVESQYGELIKEMYRNMSISRVATVLRLLVSEDVSINNLRVILEALVAGGGKTEDDNVLADYVRTHLKDQISHRYCQGNNMLPVIIIDPATEELLGDSVRQTPQGVSLVLSSEDSRAFHEAIKTVLGKRKKAKSKVVILTSQELRRYVRQLIEQEFYQIPVLSYQDLAPQITVQPIGKLSISRKMAA
ncbi:MAG: type III secretion system export apparatus subunit SctV [Methylococcales bacterium]|nr:type III secretion system export apparatus subunit SctV [Methylococcales bacterium]